MTTMATALSDVSGKKAAFAANQRLLHFPGVAGAQKLAEVAGATLGDDVFDLLIHQVFIARHVAPRTKNTDGRWEIRAVLHMGELKSVRWPRMVFVVNDQVRLRDAVAELNDFDVAIRFPANAFIAVFSENHRLAMFELEDVLAPGVPVG